MKTLKIFLENSSHPKLFAKTFKAGGVSWADFKKTPNDYYDANTGAVQGMVYYTDTVNFAKKNLIEIISLLNERENELGLIGNKPTEGDTAFFNWLAWFAWKSMAGELIDYLELAG